MTFARLPPHPTLATIASEIELVSSVSFYSNGPTPGATGTWDKGFSLGKDTDWSAEYHDLTIRYEIQQLGGVGALFGPQGIATANATVMLALEWVSAESGWRSVGPPLFISADFDETGDMPLSLSITFLPNSIRGKGRLGVQFFLSDSGTPAAGEEGLAMTRGYRYGSPERGTDIVVDGDGSLFPIVAEDLGPDGPLWEFRRDWIDVFEDQFSSTYVSLALNTAHKDYFLLTDGRRRDSEEWTPLLRHILTSWVSALILEIRSSSQSDFDEITSGASKRASPGSIADAVTYMIGRGDFNLATVPSLMLSVQKWIDFNMADAREGT